MQESSARSKTLLRLPVRSTRHRTRSARDSDSPTRTDRSLETELRPMRLESLRGTQLHGVEVDGARTRVVLLPALGLPANLYAPWLRTLAGKRAGCVLDLPGFGISPSPVRIPCFSQHLALLHEALRRIGEPVVLVGHSLSCALVIALGRLAPELLQGIVLSGFGQLHSSGTWRRQLRLSAAHPQRLLHPRRMLVSEPLTALRESLERSRRVPAFESFIDAQGAAVLRDGLRDVAVPVLVCQGDHDRVAPREATQLTAEQSAESRLQWLPNCGHMAPLEAPEAFQERIEEFARELESRAALGAMVGARSA